MSHMVIYRSAEGKPAYHQTEEMADAASFVERLRNEEGVESARIFRLDEIIFDFRTVYQVRISGKDGGMARESGETQVVTTSTPPVQPVTTPPSPPAQATTASTPAADSAAKLASRQPTTPPNPAPGAAEDLGDAAGTRRGLFGR